MRFPGGVYIVAESGRFAALDAALAQGETAMDVTRVELPLESAIPGDVVTRAAIVVVEADPRSQRSMQRISELRAARPYMPVIVALEKSDLGLVRSLIREGVNDVVALPFDLYQLNTALLDAAVGAETRAEEDLPPAELVALIGSNGGVGATTIATHLASSLAAHADNGCCIIDLDIQFGTVGSYLGESRKGSIVDLIDAGDRIDGDLLQSVLGEHGEGLRILGAPKQIMPLEDLDIDQVLRILAIARRKFGSVVVDLPGNFTNWSLSVLSQASSIVLVVELTIASLRQAKRRLDLLTDLGIDRKKVAIVVNRVEHRMFRTIDLSDVETALGVPALASVANEHALLSSAQDQGLLAHELARKNRLSTDIDALAELLRHKASED